jgi:hypothetical protein
MMSRQQSSNHSNDHLNFFKHNSIRVEYCNQQTSFPFS